MKRWLTSAFTLALAIPAIATAQTRDTTYTRTDTTVTRTQTQTTTDTTYRGTGFTGASDSAARRGTYSSDTARRTYAPPSTYAGTSTTTTTTVKDTDDDTPDQRGGFEFKLGPSWGNVSNRGVLPGSLRGRNGWALGVGMFGGSPVGFGVEGLYVQRGIDSEVSLSVNDRHLDYIDVPGYL